MSIGEYPTEEFLKVVREFPYTRDYNVLLLGIWDYFQKHGAFKFRGNTYYLATGGWSGCEDIIAALKENHVFWSLCWYKSMRGGAYWLRFLRLKRRNKNDTRTEPALRCLGAVRQLSRER